QSNGCPNDTANFEITVHPRPTANFNLAEEIICGLPDTVELLNESLGAIDYLWDFGNGFNSVLTNSAAIYTEEGDRQIQLIATTAFNCKDTTTQLISLNHQPTAEITPRIYVGCEPDTVVFSASGDFADEWFWDFGDGLISEAETPIHGYPEAGTYLVDLWVGNNGLCFDSTTVPSRVTINPSPTAFFTTNDLGNGIIDFINGSEDAIRYLWEFEEDAFSDDVNPSYEYFTNGPRTISLTAIHENGCEDIYTLDFMPDYFFGLHFPNALSPDNGTGEVRVFKPKGIGIEEIHVQVFSRWGQLLWESHDVLNEQPTGEWDGTNLGGEAVPQGTYVWKVWVKFVNDIEQVRTGNVTVIR
ncbi:MAG: PKD domain-containing protein, partial [Bacteroidota bacterium]